MRVLFDAVVIVAVALSSCTILAEVSQQTRPPPQIPIVNPEDTPGDGKKEIIYLKPVKAAEQPYEDSELLLVQTVSNMSSISLHLDALRYGDMATALPSTNFLLTRTYTFVGR